MDQEATETSQARLLLVDDDSSNLHMLRETLLGLGHKLLVATDGETALSIARKQRPELILLDIIMPGMDGYQVCETLKAEAETKDSAVIFLTALDRTEDKVRGLGLGAVDFIAKPFQPEEVIARVNTHLTVQRLQRDLAAANQELEQANQRMKRDLEAAARVQHAFLPRILPDPGQVVFEWRYHPCDELAGDSLNVFWLNRQHIGLYVLDVCGHGVPAALLSMAVSRSLSPRADVSSLVLEIDSDSGEIGVVSPAQVLGRLNALYLAEESGGLYFTIVYGVLNTETSELRYASAGHPGPVLIGTDGAVETLDSTGVPVSILAGASFGEVRVSLRDVERMFMFSDGLYEERDEHSEIYGLDRLTGALAARRERKLGEAIDEVIQDVVRWHGRHQLSDDSAILALEMHKGRATVG